MSAKGPVINEKLIKKTFNCNRSGNYGSKSNIRKSRTQGSRKCDGKCPASITATIDKETRKVGVCFIETHVGHQNQLKHINIPREDKKQIATQIKLGIPYTNILIEIRGSMTNQVNKTYLMNRKDLQNIANLNNLNAMVKRHSNDVISLEARLD